MKDQIIYLWRPALEILILWYVIYQILNYFESTRARSLLRGLIVLIVMFFIFQRLGLRTLDWIMTKIFAMSVIGIFILFQPELRQGLARLGRRHLFFSQALLKEEEVENITKQLGNVAWRLSDNKIGSLIAVEREDSLKSFADTGVYIDAVLSEELLDAIFSRGNTLHDGGVIVVGSRILAAACLFPLTDDPHLSRSYGTRHRAALGLAEDSDAVVIIVSEETGVVSLAVEGHIINNISKEELTRLLRNLLKQNKQD